jgi:cytochrome c biogenesis protein CcmG/thiol:disulfide interchange protein DsbE
MKPSPRSRSRSPRTLWPLWPLWSLLLGLFPGGCGDPPPRLQTGQSPPPFELPTLDGGRAGLPLPGRVVAVRFWADWCPFCEGEMRALEPIHARYQERGLTILAVNVRQDAATARAFIRRIGIGYGSLLDADGAVARAYGVSGLPTTFFIDRQGRLAGRILGEATPEVFQAMLEPLL